MAVLM
jgi:hypothetical protein